MHEKTFNFIQSKIDSLPLPEKGKRDYYKDEKEAGLILDVRSSGSKSFYLYKKIDGKPERIFLGPYPDMKIPEARIAASKAKGQIAHGKNPQDDKRKIREEELFYDLFQSYLNRYSKVQKKSWKYDEREVNKFLSHWFKRRLSSIKKHEVQKLHEEILKNNGLYQANRILERVRAMFNKAIEWGWEGTNPTKGIKKYKEKSRDRFIQPDELPLLFKALNQEQNITAKEYILISLMTGARKSNVLEMQWDQISFQRKEWRIPESKNGESLVIPLIDSAIEILEIRKKNKKSEWVFEGEGAKGHLADPKKTWDRVRQKATLEIWHQTPEISELIKEVETKIQTKNNYAFTTIKLLKEIEKEAEKRKIKLSSGLLDLRLHDIRRTMGSYQAITGASLPIIGKTLGHKSQQSTTVYARLNNDPVRASMSKATDLIFSYQVKPNE